jgi:flagellar biosynthesis GTPase FlhF
MKLIRVLLSVGLVASVVLNLLLWRDLARQRAESEALRASAAEVEALRAENEAINKTRTTQSTGAEEEKRELARLRNEVAQLRKQAKETDTQRARMAAETAALSTQLAEARQRGQAGVKALTQEEMEAAELAKLTPEQVTALKAEANATRCVSNMKQIGLAMRIWANDHNNTFPPDLVSAKNELSTPKILFCPDAPGGVQAKDWNQLNPATISYQFLNPNGNESDPQKPLMVCPIHGHMGLSDGSVHRK